MPVYFYFKMSPNPEYAHHRFTRCLLATLALIAAATALPFSTLAATTKPASVWIEGENTTDTSFYTGKVVRVDRNGPSGGMFLRLQTRTENRNHPKPPYVARYTFTAPVAGTYNVWFSGTQQNKSWASPVSWRIDNGEPVSLKGKANVGPTYGWRWDEWAKWIFAWTRAGAVELSAGEHELEITVTEPRTDGQMYFALIDALLLTTDTGFIPEGNHPRYSTEPTWEERTRNITPGALARQLNTQLYWQSIGQTNEQVSAETAAMVLRKITARPLPSPADRARDTTEFGLHGMERPHIVAGENADSPEVARAWELIARTGVDSLRTADSCWHRLSGTGQKDTKKLHLNFDDLDHQTANAWKYGMTHLFTIGMPPGALTVGGDFRGACRPEFYPLYREYLETMFARYKDKGMAWIELGNEVDAPDVWWRGSTPAHYVQEMKLTSEALRKIAPDARTVAFAATFSRDEEKGGPKGGRRFVAECFDLGIDTWSDAYALHHLARLKGKDFPAFFRRELARTGNPASLHKKLLNTEQWGEGPQPYDGIKAFARTFFLWDMPRMDFFLARDFFENGNMKAWGLFDLDWRPKLRLLAYAFAVDSMRGRELVGIAQPAPGVEAYVLKRIDTYRGRPATPETDTPYSIVLWKTDREVLDLPDNAVIEPVPVGDGLHDVRAAFDWQIDPVAFEADKPSFAVGDTPLAIYTDTLPAWRLLSRNDYLNTFEAGSTPAPLPTSNP